MYKLRSLIILLFCFLFIHLSWGLAFKNYAIRTNFTSNIATYKPLNKAVNSFVFNANGYLGLPTNYGVFYTKLGAGYDLNNIINSKVKVELDNTFNLLKIGNELSTFFYMDSNVLMRYQYTNFLSIKKYFLQTTGYLGTGSNEYEHEVIPGSRFTNFVYDSYEIEQGDWKNTVNYKTNTGVNLIGGYDFTIISTRLGVGGFYESISSENYIGPRITWEVSDILSAVRIKNLSPWHIGFLGSYSYDKTREHQINLMLRLSFEKGTYKPYIQETTINPFSYVLSKNFTPSKGNVPVYVASNEKGLNDLLTQHNAKYIWLDLNKQNYDSSIPHSMFFSQDLNIPEGTTLCATLSMCDFTNTDFKKTASDDRGTLVMNPGNSVILNNNVTLRDVNIAIHHKGKWSNSIKINSNNANIIATIQNVTTNGYVDLRQKASNSTAHYQIHNLSYTDLPEGPINLGTAYFNGINQGSLLMIQSDKLVDTDIEFGTVPNYKDDKYDNKAMLLTIYAGGSINTISTPTNGIYRDFTLRNEKDYHIIDIKNTNDLSIKEFNLMGKNEFHFRLNAFFLPANNTWTPTPIMFHDINITTFNIPSTLTLLYYDSTMARFTTFHTEYDYGSKIVDDTTNQLKIKNINIDTAIVLKKWYNDSHIYIFTTLAPGYKIHDKSFTIPSTWQPIHDDNIMFP